MLNKIGKSRSDGVEKKPAIGYHSAMSKQELPEDLQGKHIHLVGIKGTGLCALSELLLDSGAILSGSDTEEEFYTDRILKELAISYTENFDARNIPEKTELVIYSSAYNADSNPELAFALDKGIPCMSYTEALGSYSRLFHSCGIAGVHGKTTTTALAGTLARAAALPARILAGSAVGNFNNRSTLVLGSRYFIAETCEYRRHFLNFHPCCILLTSVESDHQDYYPDYASIRDAFVEYALRLTESGFLIFCTDDSGAAEVASIARSKREDIQLVPYGFKADGPYRVESIISEEECSLLKMDAFSDNLKLKVPGKHTALDAAAAIALISILARNETMNVQASASIHAELFPAFSKALLEFRGSRRRSELLGEKQGILFMDDYGHHPTAIRTTLEGLKAFYPKRRLIVSFMSHTYTRTAALLDDFAAALDSADCVILHKIYASAREQYSGGINGYSLYEKTAERRPNVHYYEEVLDAVDYLAKELKHGDLFLSLGAGDNWKLGRALMDRIAE